MGFAKNDGFKLKKKTMTSLHGEGSSASRQQDHYEVARSFNYGSLVFHLFVQISI